MKNKFKWLINVFTLVLCVCALAIGVYAAKQASLTATGTIGFKAHGVDMNVTGYIYGHATSEDGEPVLEANKEYLTYIKDSATVSTSTTPLEIRGADASLSFGDKYFSDLTTSGKPQDIKVVLNFTNVSEFNAIAQVQITSTANINITSDKEGLILLKTGDDASGSITYTLSPISNDQGEYESFSASELTLNINLLKANYQETSFRTDVTVKQFTQEEKASIKQGLGDAACCYDIPYGEQYKNYAERFTYVEMGTEVATGAKLRWLVVGVDNNGAVAALTLDDKMALSNGFMLNKDYYLLSEKVLYSENATNYGIAFQNEYSNTEPFLNTEYGVSANDYATSNVRKYLNGTSVKRDYEYDQTNNVYKSSGTQVGFASTYTFTTEETNKIKARSITQMYETDTARVTYDEDDNIIYSTAQTGQTFPTTQTGKATIDSTAQDKFWLLSETELWTVFAEDTLICDSDSWKVFMSARTMVQGTTSGAASWWLRSPSASFANSARCLSVGGCSYGDYVENAYAGVRAAFKI